MNVLQEYVDDAVESIHIKRINVYNMSDAAQDVDEFVSRIEVRDTKILLQTFWGLHPVSSLERLVMNL